MQIVQGSEFIQHSFDTRHAACLRVAENEIFRVHTPTDDPFGAIAASLEGRPIEATIKPSFVDGLTYAPPRVNGVIGPIYVEGCEAGDLLAVTIHSVEPARFGYVGIIPGSGPLADSRKYADCTEAFVRVIEHLPGPSGTTRDGRGRYSETVTWDLAPFIGTLATTPQREVVSSLFGQGPWGGNIDCHDVCAGNVVLLNTYQLGGLLYIGDAHGGQGDTEFAGMADETQATVEVSCAVIKKTRTPGVRIVKPDSIVALGINRPLDQAVFDACFNLMDWMKEDFGIASRDAYIRLSADPGFRVNTYQMLRSASIQYVAGAEYPKSRLVAAF